jgi:hypothetical protein
LYGFAVVIFLPNVGFAVSIFKFQDMLLQSSYLRLFDDVDDVPDLRS